MRKSLAAAGGSKLRSSEANCIVSGDRSLMCIHSAKTCSVIVASGFVSNIRVISMKAPPRAHCNFFPLYLSVSGLGVRN